MCPDFLTMMLSLCRSHIPKTNVATQYPAQDSVKLSTDYIDKEISLSPNLYMILYLYYQYTALYNTSVGLCLINHSLSGLSLKEPVSPRSVWIARSVEASVTISSIPVTNIL